MAAAYKPESLVLGVVLIALGLLGTLANLGWIDLLHTLRTWWPLSLVVWGAAELAASLAARRSS